MLGRFKLLRQVGRGGMGLVFHALDTQLNVAVALKVLCLPETDQADISRFKHEVLLARRVSHPGICRIFDLHHENDIFFITMEFCSGMILERLLQQVGVLSPWHTAQIMSAVCKAMNAAHAQGVIHRDLKPGNIVVRPGYQISILDFGFSTGADITSVTKAGAAVGTVHYVSPEVLNHVKPTPAVDIYSVGVILYRCMTGYLPFGGDNIFAIMDAIRMGAVIPPRSVNPNLSKKMERVILKAMALNPADRYRSFRELRKDLEESCNVHSREMENDPLDQLLKEAVKDAPNGNATNVDVDSSSQFDLNPDPVSPVLSQSRRSGFLDRVPLPYIVGSVILTLFIIILGVIIRLVMSFGQPTNIVQVSSNTMASSESVPHSVGQPGEAQPKDVVERQMLVKGLLIGDNNELDQLLRLIARQKSGPERDALVKAALAIVKNINIDQGFVATKLNNFQGYINGLTPPERAAKAREIWNQAEKLAQEGKYQQANLMLNTIVQ